MDSSRWQLIEQHFHDLVDRPHAEQTAALREIELRDALLADEVRAMIDADVAGQTILNRNPGAVTSEVLGEPLALPSNEFGPYRISALLGEGGMGVVYLGKRTDLQSQAAIKVLRDSWLSPSRRERFLAEQRTLASLEHVGIARLLDADRLTNGTPWFAMEYVEGTGITEYCWQQKLPLGARLALFRQACDAVRFAHERGVIHRDIKPGNVLVNHDGQVKLLDFGIAKILRPTGGAADLTQTQQRMLTPAYASPEQLRGAVVGVQTDVFSLGVLLYEMLSGVRPYVTDGMSAAEAAKHIETETAERVSVACRHSLLAVRLSELGKGTRADLDALVACAIRPDAARRYRNADALLADLARFDQQQPLAAQPDSTRYRLRKFLARNWKSAAVLTLIVGAGTAGAVSYTSRIKAARDTAEAETARVSQLKDFLVSMFDGGDSNAGPTDALKVSDLIDNGIRKSRARSADPTLQANLFGVLGYAAGRTGKPAVADTLLREAVRLQRQVHGSDSREAIDATITYASHLKYIGKADTALALFRVADASARKVLPVSEPVRALATEQFGYALAEADSSKAGLALLEEAVRLRAGIDSTSMPYADALSTLSNAVYYSQNFARAESLTLAVIRITERNLGPDHPSIAVEYINLGNIALSDGRYADTERWARKALALVEPYYGPDHYRTGQVLKQLGQALSNQDKSKEAHPHLLRALAIQERVLGPNSAAVAGALISLGGVEVSMKNYPEALRIYERTVSIFTKLYGPEHKNTLLCLGYESAVLLLQGRVDTAATIITNAVRVAERTMPAHFQELALLRIRLGRTRFAQKRYREAVDLGMTGLASLEKTTSTPTNLTRGARRDIRKAYLAIGDSANAAKFENENARFDTPPATEPKSTKGP